MRGMRTNQIEYERLDTLITKQETAGLMGGVSRSYINQLLAQKKLPKIRLSYRVVRIPRQAVLDFITSRTMDSRVAK